MSPEIVDLIKRYRQGNICPADQSRLLSIIGEFPIFRFLNKNSLLDNDDIKAEYWFGVAVALKRADLRRPDSILAYIRKYGVMKVKTYKRRMYSINLSGTCDECNKLHHFNNFGKSCRCGGDVKYRQVNVYNDKHGHLDLFHFIVGDRTKYSDYKIDTERFIAEFDNHLTGRHKEVFHYLMDMEVIGSDNYIAAIARKAGMTEQNVLMKIKGLADKMARMYRETGISIDGNPRGAA